MVRGIRRRHLLQGAGSFDKFQTRPSLRNNNKTWIIVSYKYNFLSSQEKLFSSTLLLIKKKSRVEQSNTILVNNILRIYNFIHLFSFIINKKKSHTCQSNTIFLYTTYNFIYLLYYQRIFPANLKIIQISKYSEKKKRFPSWKSKIQINSTFHRDHSISTWIGEKETWLDGGDGESGSDVGWWCSSHRQATRSKFRVRWEAAEDLDSPLYIDRAYVVRASLQWCT